MRFPAIILTILLYTTPTLAFDWSVLVTESLSRTDLWQTEEWYAYSMDSPRCLPSGYCFWEATTFLAGREWDHVKTYLTAVRYEVPRFLLSPPWSDVVLAFMAIHQWGTILDNNRRLDYTGLGSRWVIGYRVTW